jgi:hypothetical protein
MLYALVIACTIGAPSACIHRLDIRGPYSTTEACVRRLEEIREMTLAQGLLPRSGHCATLPSLQRRFPALPQLPLGESNL